MESLQLLQETTKLLEGQLRDSNNNAIRITQRPLRLVQTQTCERRVTNEFLSDRGQVAIAVSLTGASSFSRIWLLMTNRLHIYRARRSILKQGATRLRVFAVIPIAHSSLLVYELDVPVQNYIERYVVTEKNRKMGLEKLMRYTIAKIAGVSTAVELVMITGDRQ